MSYPTAKLERFLRHRPEFVLIDDTRTYKRLRVQLHGQGIVLRDEVSGSDIRTKQQRVVRAGDFVVAEIDAKVGGFGIVPPDLKAGIVSSHYFVFDVDTSTCRLGWLEAFIRSGRLEDQVKAKGSTNYAAIRPQNVLAFEIPLPTPDEQERILGYLEKVQAAVELHRDIGRDLQGLLGSTLRRAFLGQL